MTESSKIYFRELSSNTKQELEELKRILRLLPMKKRNELVDFILKEKEEGPLYLQKEIVQQLTSAYFLPATKQTKARAAFLFDNKKADLDLRKLPDIDAAYPLYIECKAGKIKQIADKIFVYSKMLCSLNDMELSVFAFEVLKPDTKQERQQKAIRYEKLKEKAAILHNQKCKKDNFYKQLTSESNNLSNGNLITRGLKQIENFALMIFKRQIRENQ